MSLGLRACAGVRVRTRLGLGLYDLKVDLKALAGAANSRASLVPGFEGP